MAGRRTVAVAVVDGLAESERHTVALCEALRQRGYSVVDSPAEADVIVTHSAGAFLAPSAAPRQLMVLINPPCWPGKSLIVSSVEKVARDLAARAREGRIGEWLVKTAWNVVALVRDGPDIVSFVRCDRQRRLEAIVTGGRAVIVRNEDDAWCSPDIERLMQPGVRVVRVSGEHDDCLHNPRRYVELIDEIMSNDQQASRPP